MSATSQAFTQPANGAPAFPLRVARHGRHLEDSAGRPFLIHGDTAWSLIVQLRLEDAEAYLRDRHTRGFNAILVNLIEHRFGSRAPANIYGEPPFRVGQHFTQPNEAYFLHADRVLRLAERLGLLVILAPAYIGTGGGPEGWYAAMRAAGPARLRDYGAFVGRRYGAMRNILWLHGGDYDPPDRGPVLAVAEGLRPAQRHVLHSAHCAAETTAARIWGDTDWLDVDNVYTYRAVWDALPAALREPRRRPFFLVESCYENEHGATSERLRTQAYQALLGGACGHLFGNNPIWHFDAPGAREAPVTWRAALSGPGTRGMERLHAVFRTVAWQRFDVGRAHEILPVPRGEGFRRQVAAITSDRLTALVHLPEAQPVTVDLRQLQAGRLALRWIDPSSGSVSPVHGVERAIVSLRPPGRNQDRHGDWLLEVRANA